MTNHADELNLALEGLRKGQPSQIRRASLSAILGLLVNLAENDCQNRSQLAVVATNFSVPTSGESEEANSHALIPLLCSIFLSLQGTCEASEDRNEMTWGEKAASIQEGEHEPKNRIIEAYAALLLGFLSIESKTVNEAISSCLPDRSLKILVPVLERFLAFRLKMKMISLKAHAAVSQAIKFCRRGRFGTLTLAMSGGGGRYGEKYVIVSCDGMSTLPADSKGICWRAEMQLDKTKIYKRRICGAYSGGWNHNDTTDDYLRTELLKVLAPTLTDVETILRRQEGPDDYEMVFGTFEKGGKGGRPTILGIKRTEGMAAYPKYPTESDPKGKGFKYVAYGSGSRYAEQILGDIDVPNMKLYQAKMWMERAYACASLFDDEVGGYLTYRVITNDSGSPRVSCRTMVPILPQFYYDHVSFLYPKYVPEDYSELTPEEMDIWQSSEQKPARSWMDVLAEKRKQL